MESCTEKITQGTKHSVTEKVTGKNTAIALGSGSMDVYATPAMTCLMERAATEAVEPLLSPGWTTVGISLNVQHKAATPVGMEVRAEAQVQSVDGRKIVFAVNAYDEHGEIGSGVHERFAVLKEKFMAKALAKKERDI